MVAMFVLTSKLSLLVFSTKMKPRWPNKVNHVHQLCCVLCQHQFVPGVAMGLSWFSSVARPISSHVVYYCHLAAWAPGGEARLDFESR